MSVQYYSVVSWDSSLIDVETTDSENTVAPELVQSAVKITTGAPTATANKFMRGAFVQNAVDGTVYVNTGTTASPVFKLVDTSGAVSGFVTVLAGSATGGTTATRAYTITGALSTDIATAVIRASQNAASIQKATLTTDTLTVLFSTDPGTGTSVDYTIVRAA